MPSQSKLLGDLISAAGAVSVSGSNLVANTVVNSAFQTGSVENYFNAQGLSIGRNRIINGDMRIDQRNAGASVTPTATVYGLDRWKMGAPAASKYSFQQNAASVTPPVGFTNYLGITSLSSYTISSTDTFLAFQYIEGYNTADLAWGTANAKTVTLSFWVYSSLTGTFGGCLGNGNATRSYPFTYTISAANTWEQKTITIAGDTSGTWLTTTSIGIGLYLGFGVGSTYSGTAGAWAGAEYYGATGATSVVGTNGATFYITGVQLEIGSTATTFERRLYNQELANCQRYYEKTYDVGVAPGTVTSSGCLQYNSATSGNFYLSIPFVVFKRIQGSTVTWYNPSTGASGSSRDITSNVDRTTATDAIGMSRVTAAVSGNTAGNILRTHWVASAEL